MFTIQNNGLKSVDLSNFSHKSNLKHDFCYFKMDSSQPLDIRIRVADTENGDMIYTSIRN